MECTPAIAEDLPTGRFQVQKGELTKMLTEAEVGSQVPVSMATMTPTHYSNVYPMSYSSYFLC